MLQHMMEPWEFQFVRIASGVFDDVLFLIQTPPDDTPAEVRADVQAQLEQLRGYLVLAAISDGDDVEPLRRRSTRVLEKMPEPEALFTTQGVYALLSAWRSLRDT